MLTAGSEEARVALAGVIVDGLYTFTTATAGCRSAGSYRKHETDEDDQLVWCLSCIFICVCLVLVYNLCNPDNANDINAQDLY